MATRSGSIDPGILFHVMRTHGLSVDTVEEALNKSSGLLGLSGVSGDYRDVEKAAATGNQRAKLALDIYSDAIVSVIGAYAALLSGLDALVFTGGVGENRASLRASVSERLGWIGMQIDSRANEICTADQDIAAPASRMRVLVIRTREDLMIARAALACH